MDPGSRSLADLTARLRREERRLTGPRQAILDVLRTAARPLSSREIHGALPAGGCDLVTVYRSLSLLEELAMVQRSDLGDGVARYELRDPDTDAHHHHIVCRRCAAVVPLEGCELESYNDRVAALSGFTLVCHRLEFFGLCPRCQRELPPGGAPDAVPPACRSHRHSSSCGSTPCDPTS